MISTIVFRLQMGIEYNQDLTIVLKLNKNNSKLILTPLNISF